MTKAEMYDGVAETFDPKAYLDLMRKVGDALSELVEYCEVNDVNFQAFICENYPFEHSLDEVACGVGYWVDTAEETLERIVEKAGEG